MLFSTLFILIRREEKLSGRFSLEEIHRDTDRVVEVCKVLPETKTEKRSLNMQSGFKSFAITSGELIYDGGDGTN
jgi:hypothetical protein